MDKAITKAKENAQRLRDEARRRKLDFMDVRLESGHSLSVLLQDRKLQRLAHSEDVGGGVRVLYRGAWGFACVDSLDYADLILGLDNAAKMARESARSPGKTRGGRGEVVLAKYTAIEDSIRVRCKQDPDRVPLEEKVSKLRLFEREAISQGRGKLANTIISYGESKGWRVVCNTYGALIDSQGLGVSVACNVTAKRGILRQNGYVVKRGRCGFELVRNIKPKDFSRRAAQEAVELLTAVPPPAGKFTVVMNPAVTGLFIHEALGHNAEADAVVGGESILAGKIGERIASPGVSVVDDSTIPGAVGSFIYDAEGVPGEKRQIIKNGVLVGYMHSLETAGKLGVTPNGSARAQSYDCRPIVRMSNTYMKPGKTKLKKLLAGVEDGILLTGEKWGYVMVEGGDFTCCAGGGRRIHKGELKERLRDVAVSGSTLDTLQTIDCISDDFSTDMGGNCGKDGQSALVTGGGPYVRVKELVVGGRR